MNPLEELAKWWKSAGDDAMTLVTVGPEGAPSARTVLLKAIDDDELVFGTSLDSRKGRELVADPRVACLLHWPAEGRQVRVEGTARVAAREETEALWASRGRDGKLVDHVSDEGAPLGSPEDLADAFAAADAELGENIPCPEDWAAVRIRAEMVELWEAGPRRQAQRRAFRREGGGWRSERLWP